MNTPCLNCWHGSSGQRCEANYPDYPRTGSLCPAWLPISVDPELHRQRRQKPAWWWLGALCQMVVGP